MPKSIIRIFVQWFFAQAPLAILGVGQNFLLWAWHFFSIGYFLPRLFSPWHRDLAPYGRGFDFQRFLHIWGWNLISRVIGAVLRLVVVVAGLIVLAAVGAATVLAAVLWLVLPLAIPALLLAGFVTPLLS